LRDNIATLATFGEHLLNSSYLAFDTAESFCEIDGDIFGKLHDSPFAQMNVPLGVLNSNDR
jgi:hypothetical protein